MNRITKTFRLIPALARAAVLTLALGTIVAAGHGAPAEPDLEPVAVTSNQIPVPPAPMGWASWNSFAQLIDYNVIKQQADALISSGMAAAGYTYVNIDSGWWDGSRDSAGNIVIDTGQWPGGMTAIVDYIHSRGLKAGIYTDAGRNGCSYYYPTPYDLPPSPGTGSEGHYERDFLQFSRWGFDFVKVDWCGGQAEGLDQKTTFTAIGNAVANATAATGRPLALSLCEWGSGLPWNWAPGLGPMWRTSTDIIFWGETATMSRVYGNFDKGLHPTAQHTGYYNDPDMLTLGMNGLSAAQNRTHMSLWAISGAPLLAGNNLATMSSTTSSILRNPEVLAVAQDARGLQAVEVAEDAFNRQVYGKVLSGNGRRAVVLLNRTGSAATMTVRWADLGLSTASASVRNLWTATNAGSFGTSYSTSVPAGEAVMLLVQGTEAPASTYTAAQSGNTSTVSGVNAANTGLAVATIEYANGGSAPRKVTLSANNGSQVATTLALPPTGGSLGTVSAIVSLAKGANSLSFTGSGTAAGVTQVEVRAIPGTNGTQIRGNQSGRCADVDNNRIDNGTQAQLWDCSGGRNQSWTYTSRGELVVYGNKCLDAYNNGTSNGTTVVIWDCNGQNNQKWTLNSNGTITNNLSGLCLDASGAGTANGTKLILWSCGGGANQAWTRN